MPNAKILLLKIEKAFEPFLKLHILFHEPITGRILFFLFFEDSIIQVHLKDNWIYLIMKLNYSVSGYRSFFLIPEPDKSTLRVTADGFSNRTNK